MPKIHVLATDGNTIKKIFWLEQKKTGVYYGFAFNDMDVHGSYHINGKHYQTIPDKKAELLANGPRLDQFTGTFQLASLVVRVSSATGSDFKTWATNRKAESALYIDTRFFTKGGISLCVLLVDYGNLGIIESIVPYYSQAHVFSKFKPWVVIMVQETMMS